MQTKVKQLLTENQKLKNELDQLNKQAKALDRILSQLRISLK